VRKIVYKGSIRVSSDDLAAAKAGRKTCTIRRGAASVVGSEIDLTDGHDRTRVRVVTTDTSKSLRDLTEREVRGEGFHDRDELTADLRKYYRDLSDDDRLTVIWFELVV
jgi:hypothetical protein